MIPEVRVPPGLLDLGDTDTIRESPVEAASKAGLAASSVAMSHTQVLGAASPTLLDCYEAILVLDLRYPDQ